MADHNYGGEGTFSRLFARLKTMLGGYLKTDQLQTAVDDALSQAKESGEFDGEKGDTGAAGSNGADGLNGLAVYAYNGDLSVVSPADSPENNYCYISDIISLGERTLQVGDLLIDLVGNVYRVITVIANLFKAVYVTNIRGEKGDTGDDYVLTDADKTDIAEEVKASFTTEEWTFTLEDDSTAVKKVVLG